MDAKELAEILELHSLWLRGDDDGRRANLAHAYLAKADLSGADLRDANLSDAVLAYANLSDAILTYANLSGTILAYANLTGAVLHRTVLDPSLPCNKEVAGFGIYGDSVIGFRTKRSPYMGGDGYEVGKTYEAPLFSVCPLTNCHPGLYLCPTIKQCRVSFDGALLIRVKAAIVDMHKTPTKWRCRKFTVLNVVEKP